MEYRHELIDFGGDIPVKCFIHRLGYSPRHWHNSMELLFVVSGSVQVLVNGEKHRLHKSDVLLINSNDPHELTAEECVLIAVQIKLSLFEDQLVQSKSLYFRCDSQNSLNPSSINTIRRIIAQFVKTYTLESESKLIQAKSLCYALLYELVANFSEQRSSNQLSQSNHNHERISKIIDYINSHYSENLTLLSLAEHEFLSVPYLSKFFSGMMGVTFTEYLNQLRLTHAVTDLVTTNNTIDQIAMKNGFSNTHSFVRLFKKKYNVLPSQYRKAQPAANETAAIEQPSFNDYAVLDNHQYLDVLAGFLFEESDVLLPDIDSTVTTIQKKHVINTNTSDIPLRHSYRTFTSVGSAKELLFTDVQKMLTCLQRDVGFEYVKFHGILSDDMHVYSTDMEGNVVYSFVMVDKALDFLLSIHLKPMIQLSFMPKELARLPERNIFYTTMINSPPKELSQWCQLVEALVSHLVERYGLDVVQTWMFGVWNEPDTPTTLFGFPSDEEFYEFYKQTYYTVKGIHPSLVVCAPSTYFSPYQHDQWLIQFTEWCKEQGFLPDCVIFHYYGTKINYVQAVELGRTVSFGKLQLTDDENAFTKAIDNISAYVKHTYPPDTKLYLTEWNFSPSHKNLLGDTCFRSCYIVKNILENYDRIDSFGYWLLTDLYEEQPLSNHLFHGGLGLFTYNGIKKPAYYAFYLLRKLGNTLIESGDGYFLTRTTAGFALMLYNYKHWSPLFASGEQFDMTYKERYTPFAPERRIAFDFLLSGVANGNWRIKEYSISRQSGSCFDKWVEMGAKTLDTQEELDLLANLSTPMINKYDAHAENNELSIHAILDMLEVRLILINPEK